MDRYLLLLIIVIIILTLMSQKPKEKFEDFNNNQASQVVIERQAKQIRKLKKKIKKMAGKVEDSTRTTYRKKLSNKYYRPKPFIAHIENQNLLNLHEDDFTGKTLSTTKFLAHTKKSNYFEKDVHFPNELCGNMCPTSDHNAINSPQIDLVRPIVPTNYQPVVK